ncbi:MAG: hypothetical protein ABSE73_15550 [Planctomycetota bacterium]
MDRGSWIGNRYTLTLAARSTLHEPRTTQQEYYRLKPVLQSDDN